MAPPRAPHEHGRIRRPSPLSECGSAVTLTVLLPNPGLIGEPDLYRLAINRLCDFLQAGGKVFLKPPPAAPLLAGWRGRAESLRSFMARNSRLSVCLAIVMRNSSQSQWMSSAK